MASQLHIWVMPPTPAAALALSAVIPSGGFIPIFTGIFPGKIYLRIINLVT
jgi:hypothetical protein